MKIVFLDKDNSLHFEESAKLLQENFECWSGMQTANDEISNVNNLKGHPFEFYIKCGYKIVGIIPDANGYGKPDIMMAKRMLRL